MNNSTQPKKINENVLICGVVKNCGNKIVSNVNLAINTGKAFNDYKVIIYENNSTDNTKDEFKKYSNNKRLVVISEDITITKSNSTIWAYTEITGSDHPCRIEMISNARNKVLDELNKDKYDNYNYVIWIDMDSNGWDIEGIIDSFAKKDYWDVVYANNPDKYYDLYAFRNNQYPFGPEIIGEHFWYNLPNFSIKQENNLIPVYSAFGGIGIYKKDIFKRYRFNFILNDTIKSFYKKILKSNIHSMPSDLLNIIKSPDMKFVNGYKDDEVDIFWKSNSGYDKPVVCEHVALNFALVNNGYKVCINPRMIYKR